MNKLVLSLLVVGALIGGHMVRATDEPTSGAAQGVVGITGGAGEPLSAATERLFEAVKADNVVAIQAAITTGAEVNALDNDGLAPLHWAAMHGHKAAVKALLAAGADVNAKDVYLRKTPLYDAAGRGHLPVVQYLLAAGAEVNAQTWLGETPLHDAAENGHLPVVECLLAAGADPNAQTQYGHTPLHWAVFYDHLLVVECLLAAGANLNTQTAIGWTALHYAAGGGHLPVVECLLALPQVDLTLTNSRGETAQDLARAGGHDHIANRIGAEIAARHRRWSPLRKAFIGALVGAELDAARAALAALLAEGDGAPTSAAGGGSAGAGPGDDKSGYEEHKK